MAISSEKAKLREIVTSKLKEQSSKARELKSKLIASKLQRDPVFQKAQVIMFYVSTAEEVDTRVLLTECLAAGKRITVPLIDQNQRSLVSVEIKDFGQDLVLGSYGILEPKNVRFQPFSVEQIEIVLVPGVAFDRAGYRLGRGKGYYDRFLCELNPKTIKIGLAFDIQMVDRVPHDPRDVQMDQVLMNE